MRLRLLVCLLLLVVAGPVVAQQPSVVNERLELVGLGTESDPATSTFSVIATFRNVGLDAIADPYFDVVELSGSACPCSIEGGFAETFDAGAGQLTLGGATTDGWAFDDSCQPSLSSPAGPGTLRWGASDSCATYGGPVVTDVATTPLVNGEQCTLSFSYYLDLATPEAGGDSEVVLRTGSSETPLLELEQGELLNNAEWISVSAPIVSDAPFRLDFVASATDAASGAGWFIDDVAVECDLDPAQGDTIAIDLDDGLLAPGELFTQRFDISLSSFVSFTFFVDVWGQVIVQPVLSTASGLNFGEVLLGNERTLPLQVSNLGSAPLSVTSITSDSPEFVPSVGLLFVPAGSTQTVDVTFAPSAVGPFAGTLTLASDDPDNPVVLVDLTGSGVPPPDISASPGSFSATLSTGELVARSLTIFNDGPGPLDFALTTAVVTQPVTLTATFVHPEPAAGSLPPSGTQLVSLFLSAENLPAGDYGAQLIISSNDPDTPQLTIPGTLDAVDAPDIEVAGDVLTIESRIDYNVAGARTEHDLSIPVRPVDDAILQLFAEGNYESGGVDVFAEGLAFGTAGANGVACSIVLAARTLKPREAALLTANGSLNVEVVNDLQVGAGCPDNAHTVRLSYLAELTEIDFGSVFVGETSEQPIVVANDGALPLDVSDITLDSAQYAVDTTSFTLQPGDTRAILVSFAPTAGGTAPGLLQILSNDPDQPALDIGLAGVAVEPQPPDVRVEPLSISAVLPVGGQEFRTLRLENLGDSDLEYAVTAEWSAPPDPPQPVFVQVVPPATGSLAPSTSVLVQLVLATGSLPPGTFEAEINVLSNDPDSPTVTVPVTLVIPAPDPPNILVQPGALAATLLPGDQALRTLIISNDGEAVLQFELAISGTPFVSVDPSSASVASMGSVSVAVTLDSTALPPGSYLSTIHVISNDPDQPVVEVPVTLNVLPTPDLEVDPQSLTFAPIFAGAISDLILTLSNVGQSQLLVDSITTSSAAFIPLASSGSLAPGSSFPLTVRFAPLAPGLFEGTLTIASNDPDQPVLLIPLSGTGLGPAVIGVSPGSIESSLVEGTQESRTLTISNSGPEPLEFTLTDTGTFVTVTPTSGSIPGSGSLDVSVTLDSEGLIEGSYEAQIDIASNDPVTPLVVVPVTLEVIDVDPMIDFEPGAFQAYLAPGTQEQRTLTILNEGGSTLDFATTVAITSPVSTTAVFVALDPEAGSVAPSGSLDVMLTIDSTGLIEGLHRADVVISSNDPDLPAVQVPVTLRVGDLIPADIRVQPESLAVGLPFGGQAVRALTLSNRGTTTLDFELTSSGAPFVAVDPATGSVPGFDSLDVSVTFDANGTAAGAYPSAIGVTSNDPDQPDVTVPVVLTVSPTGEFDIDPRALIFPATVLEASYSRSVTVQNLGSQQLLLYNIASDVAGFSSPAGPIFVLPGSSVSIDVVFTPTVPGVSVGALAIETNDAQAPVVWIALTGVGLDPPVIGVTPTSLQSVVTEGAQQTRTLTISNGGPEPLQFLVTDTAPFVAASLAAGTVPAFSTLDVPVALDSAGLSPGLFEAQIKILSNDPVTPQVVVPVVLEVLDADPIIAVEPGIFLSTLASGAQEQRTLTISNNGGSTLDFASAVTISAPVTTTAVFVTLDPDAGSVSPLGSLDVALTIDSAGLSQAAHQATIEVSSNDPDQPTVQVPVTLVVDGLPGARPGLPGSVVGPSAGDRDITSGSPGSDPPVQTHDTGEDAAPRTGRRTGFRLIGGKAPKAAKTGDDKERER